MKIRILSTLVALTLSAGAHAQAGSGEFKAGEPLGTINEAGVPTPMSSNVKVYGSFRFSESCTFDPSRNLILAMNAGVENVADGYVSLINPDGSVHTAKWIGATRDGLELNHPRGSAISNGVLYLVSDESRYVTGTQLKIDAGATIR